MPQTLSSVFFYNPKQDLANHAVPTSRDLATLENIWPSPDWNLWPTFQAMYTIYRTNTHIWTRTYHQQVTSFRQTSNTFQTNVIWGKTQERNGAKLKWHKLFLLDRSFNAWWHYLFPRLPINDESQNTDKTPLAHKWHALWKQQTLSVVDINYKDHEEEGWCKTRETSSRFTQQWPKPMVYFHSMAVLSPAWNWTSLLPWTHFLLWQRTPSCCGVQDRRQRSPCVGSPAIHCNNKTNTTNVLCDRISKGLCC